MLVTGANGYVGKAVVDLLLQLGVPVRAMVRSEANAADLRLPGVEIVLGELRDRASLDRAVAGISGIFHIAAIFRQAGFPEEVFFDINANGTRNLFEAAIAAGVKRIVHCSTGGVLGHVSQPPGNENSPYNPGDMYQRSKLAGEKIAMEYFRSGKIGGVVIRPAMIYGPGDTRHLKLFKTIAHRKFIFIGDGKTHAHFVDVRDLAKAFILAMEKEDCNAQIYHIPGERAVPLKEVVNLIADYTNVPRPKLHIPAKPVQLLGSLCEAVCAPLKISPPIYRRRVDFFTKNRHFDGSKAARELGYKPAKPFESELREVVDWYKQNNWL
ncbi:MAG: NAD-dependent epimerase/dehydratase family protein [Bdellovibrionota bacterium]